MSRNPEYYSQLERMNEQFLEQLNNFQKESPYYDYSPCCNDYIRHIHKLESEFPEQKETADKAKVEAPPQDDEDQDEDGDNKVPAEPPADRYEEPDYEHSYKCRLYHLENKSYLPKGVGVLFLKKSDTSGQFQLIIRAEPDLRRVLLNVRITSSTICSTKGKSVHIALPDDSEKYKVTQYAIKLKDDVEAVDLFGHLDGLKK